MNKKILIVDDSPVSRKIIRKCLPKNLEFEVFEAENGKDGLEKFVKNKPEITFLDLTMPVMDGIEALGEIRKINGNATVLVLTADIQQKTVDKVMELGALMVVPKPVSAEAIEKAVTKAIQNSNQ
jgi:two-component system chemotaxis response regulator CheY